MRDIIEVMGDDEKARMDKVASSAVVAAAEGNSNGEQKPPSSSRLITVPRDCRINIVCLPAHDEADEICNLMLAQLLELRGYCAFAVSQNALASEMIAEIEARQAEVVVVSALPPGAVNHARYLCKRVQARYPEAKLAVGLWSYGGDVGRARQRITCGASVALVVTLTQMQEQIDQMAHAAIANVQGAAQP
jgi:hypothetical protein